MRRLISFVIALVGIASLYSWGVTQAVEYTEPSYGELKRGVGKTHIQKPWKTAPFIVMTFANGQELQLSCAGPYGNRYWCSDIESQLVASPICTVAWMQAGPDHRPLVFEMICNHLSLINFSDQVARFSSANRDGPSSNHLLLGIGALIASFLVLTKAKEVSVI